MEQQCIMPFFPEWVETRQSPVVFLSFQADETLPKGQHGQLFQQQDGILATLHTFIYSLPNKK